MAIIKLDPSGGGAVTIEAKKYTPVSGRILVSTGEISNTVAFGIDGMRGVTSIPYTDFRNAADGTFASVGAVVDYVQANFKKASGGGDVTSAQLSEAITASEVRDAGKFVAQNGGTIYHTTKWFTPSGNVTTSGTTVTSVGTQFSSSMVGARIIISGQERIITGYTSATVVTVNTAFSPNLTNVAPASWGVYSRASWIDSSGNVTVTNTVGALVSVNRTDTTGFINTSVVGYEHNAASNSADSVNDIRISRSVGNLIVQRCTVGNATKGAGTWVDTDINLGDGNLLAVDVRFPSGKNSTIAFKSDYLSKLNSPISANNWVDIAAFNQLSTPIYETTTNNATWGAKTFNNKLVDRKANEQIIVIDNSLGERACRFTWTNFAYMDPTAIVLASTYHTNSQGFSYLIEYSSNGSTWTAIHTSTTTGMNGYYTTLNFTPQNSNGYLRVTITNTTNTASTRLLSLSVLTSRRDVSGNVIQGQLPYNWDENRKMTFPNDTTTNGVAMSKFFIKAGLPTTSDLPNGYQMPCKNTSDGKVYLCVNDGGVIKKIELT